MEMTELSQVLSKLTNICSRAEHCSYEMKEKMNKWGVPGQIQKQALDYLYKEQYIDDVRFCRFFVKEKLRFNKWGPLKIEQALRLKHIDKHISDKVFQEIPEDNYLVVLKPLLDSKLRSVKAESCFELKQKLIRFAYSRGFTLEQIEKCL